MDKEYYTSERFIWDELLEKAQAYITKAQELWDGSGSLPGYAFAWPGEALEGDDGSRLDGVILMALPVPFDTHRKETLAKLVDRTKAYALLLIEQKGDALIGLLESHHGTRCWKIPIQRHGDVWRLGRETVTDNTETLGCLWSRSQGRA